MTGFANQQCKYSAFLQNMKKYRNNFTDFPSSDTLSFPVRGKTKRGIRFCGHPSSSLVRIPDDPLLGYDADIGTILEQRRHQLELVARIDDHFLLAEIKRREAFDRRKEMVVSPYGRQIAERSRRGRFHIIKNRPSTMSTACFVLGAGIEPARPLLATGF